MFHDVFLVKPHGLPNSYLKQHETRWVNIDLPPVAFSKIWVLIYEAKQFHPDQVYDFWWEIAPTRIFEHHDVVGVVCKFWVGLALSIAYQIKVIFISIFFHPRQNVLSPYVTMQNLALLQLQEAVCQILDEVFQGQRNMLVNIPGFHQVYVLISMFSLLHLKQILIKVITMPSVLVDNPKVVFIFNWLYEFKKVVVQTSLSKIHFICVLFAKLLG